MKKSILIILVMVAGLFFFFNKKKNPSTVQSVKNQQNLSSVVKASQISTETQKKSDDFSKKEAVEEKNFKSETLIEMDDVYFKKLDALSPDASDSKVSAALADIALNSKDIDKAKNLISQYGMRGYTAMSLIVDRVATEEPEQAKAFVAKMLEEFKSLPSTDPQARMAICGSLANLSNVDISEEVYNAIESEKDSVKRRCLFDVFTSNRNYPKEFTNKLISKAKYDNDAFIRKIGDIWQSNNKILSSQEMQPYYSQISKELQ